LALAHRFEHERARRREAFLDRRPARVGRRDQVALDFGLAIHRHRLPSDIYAVQLLSIGEAKAAFYRAFGTQL
jgi:hypothetical protein